MMCLGDWLDLAQTSAIIAASITAIIGINSWRRELKGKKRYELAEETLSLFYKVKDIISAIRSPFGHADEGKSRPVAPGENPEQKKARDRAYVLWERYLKHEDTFNKLRTVRYRFMAIFGKEATKPFDDLGNIVKGFASAVTVLSDAWYRQSQTYLPRTKEEIDKLEDLIDTYRAFFWEGMKKPDQINEIVTNMISGIEEICIPVLSKKKGKPSQKA